MSTAIHNSTTQGTTTTEYLSKLYGAHDLDGLYMAVTALRRTSGPVTRYVAADDIERIAATVAELDTIADGTGVFLAQTLSAKPGSNRPGGRFDAQDAAAMTHVWTDIDVRGPEHTGKAYPPDLASARKLVDDMGLVPTLVKRTKGGLHAEWHLEELVRLDNDADRAEAATVLKGWIGTMRVRADVRGKWAVDGVHDLARIMRVPGSTHRKDPAAPEVVEVIEYNPGATYSYDDLRAMMVSDKIINAVTSQDAATVEKQRAVLGCVDLRAAWKRAKHDMATIGEPRWLAEFRDCLGGDEDAAKMDINVFHLWANTKGRDDSGDEQGLANSAWFLLKDHGEEQALTRAAEIIMCNRLRHGRKLEKVDQGIARPRVDYIARTLATASAGKPGKPKPDEAVKSSAPKTEDAEDAPVPDETPDEPDATTEDKATATPDRAPVPASKGKTPPKGKEDKRPQVIGRGRDLHDLLTDVRVKLALAELGNPNLFFHGNDVVVPGPGKLHPIRNASLSAYLAEKLRWEFQSTESRKERDKVRAANAKAEADGKEIRELPDAEYAAMDPHPLVVATYLESPEMRGLPEILRVSRTPYFTESGRLVDAPGYDRESKTLYLPPPSVTVPAIPAEPTTEDVAKARALLAHMYQDFKFTSDAERAGVYALGVTCYMSPMVKGPAPIFAFDAPSNREGKGKLMMCTLRPTFGDSYEVTSAPTAPEEWEKKIVSVGRTGAPVFIWDNLSVKADSGALASAVTAYPYYSGRLLGKNEDARIPAPAAWCVTGKNIGGSTEIVERMVRIRIDCGLPLPGRRTGFAIKDIDRWVEQNQGELAWSWCVLIAAWVAAGQPKADTPVFGGFESWVKQVGSVLAFHSITGQLDNPMRIKVMRKEVARILSVMRERELAVLENATAEEA